MNEQRFRRPFGGQGPGPGAGPNDPYGQAPGGYDPGYRDDRRSNLNRFLGGSPGAVLVRLVL